MSSFVIERQPLKYGNQQEDWLKRSAAIVQKASERVKLAVSRGEDLTKLFHEIMKTFGDERQAIAQDHKTKEAHFFGKRRDSADASGLPMLTPLFDPYDKYNKPVITLMQMHLVPLKHPFKTFIEREKEVNFGSFLGKKFSMKFEILSPDSQEDKFFNLNSYEQYVEICQICGIKPKEKSNPVSKLVKEDFFDKRDIMGILKQKSPDLYKKLRLLTPLLHLRTLEQDRRKSDWVLVTLRLEVEPGKMYALSQYLTWLYRDFKLDPIGRMTYHSIAAIIHQDQFLIGKMLESIAVIFKQAIEWDRKNTSELMNTVASFEYQFAHCMPHIRGSGAIAEWLERTIFQFHGYNVTYDQSKMVTFEAYVSTPEGFAKNYPSMVKLSKLDSKANDQQSSSNESLTTTSSTTTVSNSESKENKVESKTNSGTTVPSES